MPYNFIKNVILNESTPSKNLELLPLPYSKGDLEPAISEDTINYHYSKLAKAYVDRYNDTLKHLLTLKKNLAKLPWAYRDQVGYI